MLLARGRFPGRQVLNGLVHLPLILPPVVTGYLLLLTFGRRGPVGGVLDEWFGIVLRLPLDGGGAGGGDHGLSADGAGDAPGDRGGRSRAGSRRRPRLARRAWVFVTVTLPLILPGVIAGAVLAFAKAMGEFGATITFVSNIPGETQTAAIGDLRLPAGAGGRGGGDAAGDRLGRDRDGGAAAVGMVGAARGTQDRRAMSLSVAIRHQLRRLHAWMSQFDAPPGRDGAVRPLGLGQDLASSNAVAGLLAPDAGRIVVDGRGAVRHGRRHSVPVHRRRSAMSFRKRGCSRI